ncbi:hypothetical protein DTO164E3_7137 [Paecilomyces variotii]|nr:hypothetical protein DTO164E3_7137 [Paecilomyces variotii]KAJ9226103.1 hypothetical protein DTO169C6_1742 [Paecilomyces variotii]KAJ9266979.1 hypothetical protein DTO195F2_914 [Paecilomyces variotii]KAJ9351844.1 hypothetical protein DTO280E4_8069 [Paecilomyces variotii]
MAPGDEYSAVSGAGKLKLKGLKVKGGRVEKKKKKKEKKEHAETSREASAVAESQQDSGEASAAATAEQEGGDVPIIEKTEAEKKYEEMRRKRLNDRLKREGVKTHKERVEELNKYLSTLSEHHDMYASPPPLILLTYFPFMPLFYSVLFFIGIPSTSLLVGFLEVSLIS